MKTHNRSLPLILLLTALYITIASCDKNDGSYSWEGRALEYGSNKPIPNATVYLMEVKGTFLGPSGSRKIDSTSTDIEGKFKFTYSENPYVSEVRGHADMYYDGSANIQRNGNKTKTDLILDPHAWLRIHVKNVNPAGEYDAIGFESFSCDSEGFVGAQIDTFSVCSNRGNRSHDIYYIVSKIGSGSQRHKLTYTLGAHDTTVYCFNTDTREK